MRCCAISGASLSSGCPGWVTVVKDVGLSCWHTSITSTIQERGQCE